MSLKTMILRMQARAGVRLAFVHAAIVVIAFVLAGYLAQVSLERISRASIRSHVAGEAVSLDDEFTQKGADHLPFTVAKRSRLWRGFDYRLVSPTGVLLAGRLPDVGDQLGWSDLPVGQPLSRPERAQRHFLIFTKTMPDGARLTIGQDMAVEAGEMRAIDSTLLICGALGVIFCVGASHLFARGTWRRIAAVATTAHAVSAGRLDVRARVHGGPPRDDVDELAHAFNGMLDRIGALVSQVRQVSTDIAHDLRTPLTRFGQKLEQLRAKAESNPEMLRAVAGLEADISEILRTFDALLQLSEIEGTRPAAQDPVKAKVADLGDVALRVAEAYRPDIEESGRSLDLDVRPALVEGDGDLLAQGLANLLENALRHTPRGSRIRVMVRPAGVGAELAVEDNGPGIPLDQRPRVIKPFVRLEPSRHTPGSGLGLAIVEAVATRHRATLRLEDAEPGLRVLLEFPRLARAPISDQPQEPSTPWAWRSSSRIEPQKADAGVQQLSLVFENLEG
jgi:signal transduction histidine kinase